MRQWLKRACLRSQYSGAAMREYVCQQDLDLGATVWIFLLKSGIYRYAGQHSGLPGQS